MTGGLAPIGIPCKASWRDRFPKKKVHRIKKKKNAVDSGVVLGKLVFMS